MACERNRILILKEYLSSLGISLNIGKNKARGHKGIFMRSFNNYRIDISDNVPEGNVISVVLHEFAHYIHYSGDKTLKTLDFFFDDFNDDIKEELIKITVNEVPKDFASALYSQKNGLSDEIKTLAKEIKLYESDFKLSEKYKKYEKRISYPYRYLLKYDRVKFGGKFYSVEKLKDYPLSEDEILYLLIKSKQRAISRINSKISRLNKYYNSPSELFARFIASYYTNPEYTLVTAPLSSSVIKNTDNPYIKKLNNIFH